MAALISGQIDGWTPAPSSSSPAPANKNLQVFGEVEGNYAFLGMNTKRPPFDDLNLRLAVAYAIDREFVKQGYFGDAIPAYSMISPPMSNFYDPAIAKSGRGQFFDLKKAQAFRAKAKDQGEVAPVSFTSNGGSGSRNAQLITPDAGADRHQGRSSSWWTGGRGQPPQRRRLRPFDAAWEADLDPDETISPEWLHRQPWNYPGWPTRRSTSR